MSRAESEVFERTCEALEASTPFSRLEARGTIRLALKQAGLSSSQIGHREMLVVLERVLPDALRDRGIEQGPQICTRVANSLGSPGDAEPADPGTSPEDVFRRLRGTDR